MQCLAVHITTNWHHTSIQSDQTNKNTYFRRCPTIRIEEAKAVVRHGRQETRCRKSREAASLRLANSYRTSKRRKQGKGAGKVPAIATSDGEKI